MNNYEIYQNHLRALREMQYKVTNGPRIKFSGNFCAWLFQTINDGYYISRNNVAMIFWKDLWWGYDSLNNHWVISDCPTEMVHMSHVSGNLCLSKAIEIFRAFKAEMNPYQSSTNDKEVR